MKTLFILIAIWDGGHYGRLSFQVLSEHNSRERCLIAAANVATVIAESPQLKNINQPSFACVEK